MGTLTPIRALVARDGIAAACAMGLSTADLLREVAVRVDSVMPADGGAWCSLDPITLQPTSSHLLVVGSPQANLEQHLRFSEMEIFVPDFLKINQLARAPRAVQSLQEATGGDVALSPRQRTINEPLGYTDEVRAAFRSGDTLWGVACLARRGDRPAFSAAELAFLESIAAHVAHGLRLALLLQPTRASESLPPGLVVLDADERVESLTPEAQAWLAEIPRDGNGEGELPASIYHVARQARMLAEQQPGDAQPAQARIRLPNGRWLILRGTTLIGSRGAPTRSAVFLEPASRAELAPLLVALYELSSREREVTELLLRGLSIDEIAARLFISRHTVRDHTKAIFAKAGVRSRPELTALLVQEPDSTSQFVAYAPAALDVS